jgi:hypothetical protein
MSKKGMHPDKVWVVAEPHAHLALGEEVSLGSGPVGGDRGLFEWSPGKFVLVMMQRRENVEDFKKVRKSEFEGKADPGHSAIEAVVDAAKQETARRTTTRGRCPSPTTSRGSGGETGSR